MNLLLAALVYVGSFAAPSNRTALAVLDVDVTNGAISVVAKYPVAQALGLAATSDGRRLYVAEKTGLVAFAVDGRSLVERDYADLGFRCACALNLAADGRTLFWADYSRGAAGAVTLTNGCFAATRKFLQYGKGPRQPRQDGPHPHGAVPTPDGRRFVVADLGLDTLVTYPAADFSEPAEPFSTPAGAGPRQVLFHPDGRLAFVAFELKNRLATYAWDARGGFRPLASVSTLATGDDGDGTDRVGAVRFTPDGGSVVVCNRGEDSLVVYGFDPATGALREKARTYLKGRTPWDVAFVSATVAVVVCEDTHDVRTFRYDPEKGAFTPLAVLGGFLRPVALLAAPIF